MGINIHSCSDIEAPTKAWHGKVIAGDLVSHYHTVTSEDRHPCQTVMNHIRSWPCSGSQSFTDNVAWWNTLELNLDLKHEWDPAECAT